jgi:hypothetical protein
MSLLIELDIEVVVKCLSGRMLLAEIDNVTFIFMQH